MRYRKREAEKEEREREERGREGGRQGGGSDRFFLFSSLPLSPPIQYY
jgi:hypothetical protein